MAKLKLRFYPAIGSPVASGSASLRFSQFRFGAPSAVEIDLLGVTLPVPLD